jgi:hypothetical protein
LSRVLANGERGERSLCGQKIVVLDMNRFVFVKCDLQQFVDRFAIAEAIEGESEQPLLNSEAHQTGATLRQTSPARIFSRRSSAVKSVVLLVTST